MSSKIRSGLTLAALALTLAACTTEKSTTVYVPVTARRRPAR